MKDTPGGIPDDPAEGNTFGHLYNWFAVNDSRNLAPAPAPRPDRRPGQRDHAQADRGDQGEEGLGNDVLRERQREGRSGGSQDCLGRLLNFSRSAAGRAGCRF